MWSKSFVAIFLAFPAAIGITGLLAFVAPGSLEERTLPVLLMFFPFWTTTISLSFLARSGLRAALWMILICIVCFGGQYAARNFHWISLPA